MVRVIYIPFYSIRVLGLAFACWMFSKMSKYISDTREIDDIAWLLITIPPQYPATFFKKAGQMTGANSIGRHYRPRLLEARSHGLALSDQRFSDDQGYIPRSLSWVVTTKVIRNQVNIDRQCSHIVKNLDDGNLSSNGNAVHKGLLEISTRVLQRAVICLPTLPVFLIFSNKRFPVNKFIMANKTQKQKGDVRNWVSFAYDWMKSLQK